MSFYDDASLVVIPSAQKTSKLYAVKPTDGSGDLTFTRTGDTATRVNSAGLIVPVLANVPRLDYLGSTCPRLLLEPQRTNLVTYSEQLDNAAWTKVQITTTANSSVSPDGYANADKIAINNGISGGYAYQSIATTSSTVYTSSFFIKAAGINFTKFFSNVTGSYVTAVINLTTGAITNSGFAVTPTATNYGNGWWRVSYTETSGGGSVPIYVDAGSTSNGGSITGNGTDGILIWGAQLEAGAYATSYIPTLAASATRGADACSKTGISSLIGQSEGVVFVDFEVTDPAAFQTINVYNNNKAADTISTVSIQFNLTEVIAYISFGNGTFGNIVLYATGYGLNQRLKVAFRYKSGDLALYVNGVQKDTEAATYTAVGTKSEVFLGDPTVYYAYKGGLKINNYLQFTSSLTNAQLAELTTL